MNKEIGIPEENTTEGTCLSLSESIDVLKRLQKLLLELGAVKEVQALEILFAWMDRFVCFFAGKGR